MITTTNTTYRTLTTSSLANCSSLSVCASSSGYTGVFDCAVIIGGVTKRTVER